MSCEADPVTEHILTLLHRYGGRRLPNGADKLMGGEHGVTGWDSIYVLEELEKAYGVDLRPFADARATTKKGWFRTVTVSGDATPRELAQHITDLTRRRPGEA